MGALQRRVRKRPAAARIEKIVLGLVAIVLCGVLMPPTIALGRELTDVFRTELANLQLEPVGDALAQTVAATYPVASASSSVIYQYNPAADAYERQDRVLGPIFGERTETLGRGQFDVSVSYSYVGLDSINGTDLDDLENVAEIDGRVVSFPIVDAAGNRTGVTLANGRFTNFLPVQVRARLNVEAQIFAPAVTYGITPDLDVNLTLPLIRTYLAAHATSTVPDPRLPQFTLQPGDRNMTTLSTSSSDTAFGVGDLLLRAKYAFYRRDPVDLAFGLGLSLPTGDPDDLQGSGTTRVQPTLIASRIFGDRFEPLINIGMDLNCDDVSRSVFRWAAGATAQVSGPLTAAVVFLGRNELESQADPIAAPFFVQIERNDIYDVSLGMRLLLYESFVVAGNVLLPLNDEGLRADVIPTVQLEYEFGAPL